MWWGGGRIGTGISFDSTLPVMIGVSSIPGGLGFQSLWGMTLASHRCILQLKFPMEHDLSLPPLLLTTDSTPPACQAGPAILIVKPPQINMSLNPICPLGKPAGATQYPGHRLGSQATMRCPQHPSYYSDTPSPLPFICTWGHSFVRVCQ